ncbi:MAG: SDR family NAD(P)-dependent oxidoreductase [Bradyrhizobium sp.]
MHDIRGKAAFITGGASGIGLALARRLLQAGARVAIADVESAALDAGLAELRVVGPDVLGIVCDVADRASMQVAARETIGRFGRLHILCNNAGVSRAGPVDEVAATDWDWVIGVNLKGVIYALEAFLPHMKAHGESGHLVNTASINGLVGVPLSGPYCATKFAVVGLSEVLAAELADSAIGVSVLCPSWVRTGMLDNGRNRPERFGGPIKLDADSRNAARNARYAAALQSGLPPEAVAQMTLDAIAEKQFYIITHAASVTEIEARQRLMRASFASARSPKAQRTA